MLVARTNEGKLLSLGGGKPFEKEELIQLRKKNQFYCTACKSEVILKLGDKHAWHFAHKKSCFAEAEGETLYHLKGKKILFEWLVSQQLNVQLEPYLKEINQKPDLLVCTNNKNYVIEFQCAKIPPQLFLKRTSTYQNNGYTPIWILGGNQIQRQSHFIYRLTSFHWLFALEDPQLSCPQIFSFCPSTNHFLMLKPIYSLTVNRSACASFFSSLQSIQFNQLLHNFFKLPTLNELWLLSKKNLRTKIFTFSSSQLYISKLLLTKNYSLALFPSEAGIPVKGHHYIETPAYLWQSWVVFMFITNKQIGDTIHMKLVTLAFNTLLKKNVFQLRFLPLMNNNYELALKEFLKFLVKLKILETDDYNSFIKVKEIDYPKSIDEAIYLDGYCMKQFLC